jgi:hypothetical protein
MSIRSPAGSAGTFALVWKRRRGRASPVTDPQQLFREFADRYAAEESADPREYLARAEGTDREELRALIDGFLERAPRREWDAAAFRGSMAERAVERAGEAEEEAAEAGAAAAPEPAGAWPEVLPELRHRARLKRSEVVERLAAALGFSDREARVGEYYHRMEQGLLTPSGVSSRVLEALGGIVGASAEALRGAGEMGEAGAAGGEVFARVGGPTDQASPDVAGEVDASAADATPAPPDELDRLFTGGD